MKLCTAKKTVLQERMAAMLTIPVLIGSLVLLTSCIDSSDDLDPSDWYSSVMGEESAPDSDGVPGADEDYPELGAVSSDPVNVSTPEEIDRVAETLAADLANAQYSTGIVRVDDETTPSDIVLPTVGVASAETVTEIAAGEEIDIAVASAGTMPEPVEVETGSSVSLVAPPPEAEPALSGGVAGNSLVIAPLEPEMAESEMQVAVVVPVESRVETETVRDGDGELVGSITTVYETMLVSDDASEADMMMAVAAAEAMDTSEKTVLVMEPVAEPEDADFVAVSEAVFVAPAAETVTVAEVSEETMVIAPAPQATAISVAEVPEPASVDGSTSLVALSERNASDTIVVVPEYMAAADISTPEPVATAVAMDDVELTVAELQPSTTAEAGVVEVVAPQVTDYRIEQESFVSQEGELVGSVTRVVETSTVIKPREEEIVAAEADSIDMVVVEAAAEADRVSATEETFMVAAVEPEPVAVVTATSAPVQSATTTQVPVISSAGVSFDALFGASSPNANVAVQNVAAVGSPTTTINDATFTTAGTAEVAQTLAAIIRFGNGSSALGAEERRIVAQLAAIHAQSGGLIRLVGHASRSGGNLQSADAALVNFKISLDRATAVANELIRNGVPRGDILIEAAAATDSMAAGAGVQNEAIDRRVEVFFGV
jgi:outer membrane protein OmpA-like peptidoglycan-associated protein